MTSSSFFHAQWHLGNTGLILLLRMLLLNWNLSVYFSTRSNAVRVDDICPNVCNRSWTNPGKVYIYFYVFLILEIDLTKDRIYIKTDIDPSIQFWMIFLSFLLLSSKFCPCKLSQESWDMKIVSAPWMPSMWASGWSFRSAWFQTSCGNLFASFVL